ncbi:MAG: YcjX family protein, partial [Flavobacteriaceae bacterium]
QSFTGEKEIAICPGDLPEKPKSLFQQVESHSQAVESDSEAAGTAGGGEYRFIRFRPPLVTPSEDGAYHLPHIRLDRALQFLIGDRLK